MQKKDRRVKLLKKISQGTTLSLVLIFFLFLYNKEDLYIKMLLYETLPFLNIESDVKMLFKFGEEKTIEIEEKTIETFIETGDESDTIEVSSDIIGTYNVIYQDDTKNKALESIKNEEILTHDDLEKMRNIDYLRSKFYIAEKTLVTETDFNIDKFLETDLKLDQSIMGPKVLIFHTHINEMYADSNSENLSDGIYGVGEELANELRNTYGIDVIHYAGEFDRIDGKSQILGAYERMEPDIREILEQNPSIEIVIDMHRDGIDASKKLLTTVDGRPTAQIMFVNGLSKIYNNNQLQQLDSLQNPNLATNLAFSFNLQLTANAAYPGFTRKVYLKPYRFSLHMKPKSLLIEVGAQTNTVEEAKNTAIPLSAIIAKVVLPD